MSSGRVAPTSFRERGGLGSGSSRRYDSSVQQLTHATNRGRLGEQCAKLTLQAIPAAMQFIREQMRRHRLEELTVPQFRALIFVHHHADASLSPMAEHIGLSLPAASRMVNALVRRGLLVRRADARDRRRLRLVLTARGQSVYRAARRATQASLAQRFVVLHEREMKTVSRALRILTGTFDLHGTGPSGKPGAGSAS